MYHTKAFKLFVNLSLLYAFLVILQVRMFDLPTNELSPRRHNLNNKLERAGALHFSHLQPSINSNSNENESQWWKGTINENRTHPYRGARHPNGTVGMIVDPSTERLRPIHPMSIVQNASYICLARVPPLYKKIYGGLLESRQQLADASNSKAAQKILCMVYTVYTDRDRHGSLAAIADTWGRECDGFFGASNKTDHAIGAIDLPHQGPEAYSNMWQKIRSIWAYAHEHYINDYDYFYIVGDDTFVLVDNMRAFLTSPRVELLKNGHLDKISLVHIDKANATSQQRPRPLLFGTPFYHKGMINIIGGGGYILNQAALKLFAEVGLPTWHADRVDSREDLLIGGFFSDIGVFVSDTQDETGGSRFGNGGKNPKMLRDLYGLDFGRGIDSESKYKIAFHLKKAADLARSAEHYMYNAFFRDWCSRYGGGKLNT